MSGLRPAGPATPRAYAGDYQAALHAVGSLHRQFHDQIAANNEGATHLSQGLDTVRVGTGAPPQLLYFSAVNSSWPCQVDLAPL